MPFRPMPFSWGLKILSCSYKECLSPTLYFWLHLQRTKHKLSHLLRPIQIRQFLIMDAVIFNGLHEDFVRCSNHSDKKYFFVKSTLSFTHWTYCPRIINGFETLSGGPTIQSRLRMPDFWEAFDGNLIFSHIFFFFFVRNLFTFLFSS